MERPAHFKDLDGMRGILACAVMLYHYGLNTLLGRLTGGLIIDARWGLCVDFFFLLSGFVLCRSFVSRRTSLSHYFSARLWRLAPMYLITLALALLALRATPSGTLLANLAMVQPYLGLPSINGPSWSIPYELFLPLLALLFAPRITSPGWAAVVFIVTIALASAVAVATHHSGNFETPLRALSAICAGSALYLVFADKRPGASNLLTLAAFAVAIAMMLAAHFSVLAYPVFFAASAMAIWWGANAQTLLSSAPAQALGRWSYSIYLLHFPIMDLTISVWGPDAVEGNVLVKGAWVIATIALAALTYRFIELPLIKYGKARRGLEYAAVSAAP